MARVQPRHGGSPRGAARAWLTAAVVLLCLAGATGARTASNSEEEEDDAAGSLFFGDGESVSLDSYRSRKQEVLTAEGAAGAVADGDDDSEDKPKETIAQRIDEALKVEFKQEEEKKEEVGKTFNETVASEEGTQETVIIISSKKKANATAEFDDGEDLSVSAAETAAAMEAAAAAGSSKPAMTASSIFESLVGHGGSGGTVTENMTVAEAMAVLEEKKEKDERKKELEEKIEAAAESDVDRIIDSKDNEYVLSKPNDEAMGMNLDPQFVKDLTVLITASAVAGLAMASLGQPTINGYFIAGSLVGPGGLKLIKEIVQVQSVAQLGVQLLLFTLGLEFSMTKLRAVRNVALLGGVLQTGLFALLAAIGAKIIGTGAAQGAFVGALVAMSSTSVVVKVLTDTRSQNTQQGQITIGTLVLQDCLVGLLFAFMPVLATASDGGSFDFALLLTVMGRVAVKLAVIGTGALVIARTVLPPLVRRLARSFGPDSFQLASIAFCLTCALVTARQGISAELGAFIAGVMLSATEQQETVLHHLEPVTQFFLCLFISSTGLVLSPVFLLHHLPVLAAGALLVIITKTVLIAGVVSAFGYPPDTALAVGMNLSQIGEFVFVLLSVANQQALLADNVYMLLMGITALTLLMTPFMLQISIKLIPKVKLGYPNGLSAGDLEMSGGGGGGSLLKPPASHQRNLLPRLRQHLQQRCWGRPAAAKLQLQPLARQRQEAAAAGAAAAGLSGKSSPPDTPNDSGSSSWPSPHSTVGGGSLGVASEQQQQHGASGGAPVAISGAGLHER